MKIEVNIDEVMFMTAIIEESTLKGKDAPFVANVLLKLRKVIDKDIILNKAID
tara:strand:- start:40 stop:198 length:159 start_codon:yes stop_codon:yes gene_type:complete